MRHRVARNLRPTIAAPALADLANRSGGEIPAIRDKDLVLLSGISSNRRRTLQTVGKFSVCGTAGCMSVGDTAYSPGDFRALTVKEIAGRLLAFSARCGVQR
jgi:hypothetical protein